MVSIRPHLRHCAACRATVRQMRFSRTRRIALLAPFGWITRVLSKPEVVQLSTSGGGRFGTAASIVGLCLTGAGAGAACVMSGALPAPAIIATVDRPESTSTPAPKKKAPAKPKVVKTKPVKAEVELPPARTYAAVATADAHPAAPQAQGQAHGEQAQAQAAGRQEEAGVHLRGHVFSRCARSAQRGVTASAASAGGGGSSAPAKSGGGGGATQQGDGRVRLRRRRALARGL